MTISTSKSSLRAGKVSVDAGSTVVSRIANRLRERIHAALLRPGMRLPSIRAHATELGVARNSVVDAYELLVTEGLIESRRGAGFYVRSGPPATPARITPEIIREVRPGAAGTWPYWRVTQEFPHERQPGSSLLPPAWLQGDRVRRALREVARQGSDSMLGYGSPLGYAPLRGQIAHDLADMGIRAEPDQIVTTLGVTHGIDLVARCFLRTGDTVAVDDPALWALYARFLSLGVRICPVPRLADGPDLVALENILQTHRPRLFFTSSALHNPTGGHLAAAKAHQLLRIAENHDLTLVEDDIFAGLAPAHAARIAALDQLQRVIYLSGYSKTIAASLRVGFIACHGDVAARLVEEKLTSAITSPELGERVVHRLLIDGHQRKHLERTRQRLDILRAEVASSLKRSGCRVHTPDGGLYLWVDTTRDTDVLAAAALEAKYLLAPGSFFNPTQTPSTWMRVNVSNFFATGFDGWLARQLADMPPSTGYIPPEQ
ncbi:MAG: PLP-dependent aminotransferase family protein [Spongiibacteraceae bacterium]